MADASVIRRLACRAAADDHPNFDITSASHVASSPVGSPIDSSAYRRWPTEHPVVQPLAVIAESLPGSFPPPPGDRLAQS